MSLEVELYDTCHITMSCRIVSVWYRFVVVEKVQTNDKTVEPRGISGYCIVVKVDGTITHRGVTCEIADLSMVDT